MKNDQVGVTTDRRSYLQESPKVNFPLQLSLVNPSRLTPYNNFSTITKSFPSPNITKHGSTDCESHKVSWACTKRRTDQQMSRQAKKKELHEHLLAGLKADKDNNSWIL